jgi:hypothetical protein
MTNNTAGDANRPMENPRHRPFWSRALGWKGRAISGSVVGLMVWLLLGIDEPYPASISLLVVLALSGALTGLLIDRKWGA